MEFELRQSGSSHALLLVKVYLLDRMSLGGEWTSLGSPVSEGRAGTRLPRPEQPWGPEVLWSPHSSKWRVIIPG